MKTLIVMGLFYLIFLAIVISGVIFWIRMIIDCAKRNFEKDNDKLGWIITLALAGVIGALIYYFVVNKKAKTAA